MEDICEEVIHLLKLREINNTQLPALQGDFRKHVFWFLIVFGIESALFQPLRILANVFCFFIAVSFSENLQILLQNKNVMCIICSQVMLSKYSNFNN